MSDPIENESKPEETESDSKRTESNSEEAESLQTSAVLDCRTAYFDSYNKSILEGLGRYQAERNAGETFRSHMPMIDEKEDIPDFIGCVAEGLLLEVFDPATAGRLLYAAQVASAAARRVT